LPHHVERPGGEPRLPCCGVPPLLVPSGLPANLVEIHEAGEDDEELLALEEQQ
jgi:hypothetical protein